MCLVILIIQDSTYKMRGPICVQFVDAGSMQEMLIQCSQRITGALIADMSSMHSESSGYALLVAPGNQNQLLDDNNL